MSGFVSAGGKRLTTRRVVVTLALSTAACALVALLAPLVGHSFELLGTDALRAGTPAHEILILRLEEIGEALLVGGALSAAGCALQALLRNPLAEPFTLGISSGASLAAVLAIRLGAERAFGGLGTSGAALLGPVAVEPKHRGCGIGTRLVKEALAAARSEGTALVVLVGDEPYYGRFGFTAVPLGQIAFPGPVNPQRILAIELTDGSSARYRGMIVAEPPSAAGC
jgi:predicted N-acetyltransferase YhbS